jgi:hypothetical protein
MGLPLVAGHRNQDLFDIPHGEFPLPRASLMSSCRFTDLFYLPKGPVAGRELERYDWWLIVVTNGASES